MYRNTNAHEHIPEDAVIMRLQNTLWRDNASRIQWKIKRLRTGAGRKPKEA